MTFADAYILFSRERDKLEQVVIDNPEDKENRDLFEAFEQIENLINVQIPAIVNGYVNLMEILEMYHENVIQD